MRGFTTFNEDGRTPAKSATVEFYVPDKKDSSNDLIHASIAERKPR